MRMVQDPFLVVIGVSEGSCFALQWCCRQCIALQSVCSMCKGTGSAAMRSRERRSCRCRAVRICEGRNLFMSTQANHIWTHLHMTISEVSHHQLRQGSLRLRRHSTCPQPCTHCARQQDTMACAFTQHLALTGRTPLQSSSLTTSIHDCSLLSRPPWHPQQHTQVVEY